MIGQTISHYKILEKLGEGGMGVVYKARDTKLDRDVAMKLLPSSISPSSVEAERFHHEAKAISSLNHPNIATIHEFGESEGQIFIVLEYIGGGTLKSKVSSGPTEIFQAIDFAVQIGDGLAHAHKNGIIHRDIKCENVMVTGEGRLKITDFGLAKLRDARSFTKTGSTVGTAAYMSPEQARGEEVDHRTDIFSFGVVLYEILTGRLPFRGEHPAALMYSIVNEEPQAISKYNDKVTPGIEQIVTRALAKDRDERYQNVDELLTDLRNERKRLESGDTGSATSPRRIFARPKRRLTRIGSVAAAVIILVILALIFNPFNLNVGVQKNIAEPKPSLAVISFDNLPDPADKDLIGEQLLQLLPTSFLQTKDLDVVSREELYRIQKDMGEGESKAISPTKASEIARRAGVSTYMVANILQVQPVLTVTYSVIDVETGKIINSQRVSGYSRDNLFPLADTLALMVKRDLHVTPTAVSTSVADVTTKSPEAYRAYVEGLDLVSRVQWSQAKIAFEKAVALDSTFAMAHYELGGWLAVNNDTNEIRKAWELRSKVTEKERLLIEARYARTLGEDPARSAEILEQLVLKYPREQGLYVELGYACVLWLGDYDRALTVIERRIRIDSLDKSIWINHAYLLAFLNRRDETLRDIPVKLRIAGLVHHTHPPLAELLEYFIVRYGLADHEDREILFEQTLYHDQPCCARVRCVDHLLAVCGCPYGII